MTDTNDKTAEAFAKAIATAETDLAQCLDAIGRPDLEDELRGFLQGLSKAVAESQTNG